MRTLALIFVLLVSQPTLVHAQESSTPWWKPFPDQPSTATASNQGSNVKQSSFFDKKPTTSTFKMPQLPKLNWLPSMGGSQKSKGPSTLGKMSQSTKKMWDDTLDFLLTRSDCFQPKLPVRICFCSLIQFNKAD